MRLIMIAMIFMLIGFFGYHFAYRLGLKSRALGDQDTRTPSVDASHEPLLLNQLDQLEALLLREQYSKARQLLEEIGDLTPSYREEWNAALTQRDPDGLHKIRRVISDLRVALSDGQD